MRRIVLRTIESQVRRRCHGAPRGARCGAVSFVQRFGSALNAHTHLHCCLTDGVFGLDAAARLRFHSAAELDAASLHGVQRRWGHGGGFSMHAAVRIEAEDRAGLERLLRYCARPAFASERLSWDGHDPLVRYTLPKPCPVVRPRSHSPRSTCSIASPR